MPDRATVMRWINRFPDFAANVARARELQQDAIVEQLRDMADAATEADWQVVKLRIWTRQWTASKLAPKKYGDKLDLNHSGAIGTTPTLMCRICLLTSVPC